MANPSTNGSIITNQSDEHITVAGIQISIRRKNVKNILLAVLPPDGMVRVTVPVHIPNDAIRLAAIERLGWIKRQKRAFQNQPRQSERQLVSGETHYFLGKAYRLKIENTLNKQSATVANSSRILLSVKEGHDLVTRRRLLENWYRSELKQRIPPLLDKWQPLVGKESSRCGVKKMKTKWGSCNTATGSIWLNLELVKKPPECIEYILVHELVHLHERNHSDRFRTILASLVPDWQERRDLLNNKPLAHSHWGY